MSVFLFWQQVKPIVQHGDAFLIRLHKLRPQSYTDAIRLNCKTEYNSACNAGRVWYLPHCLCAVGHWKVSLLFDILHQGVSQA